MLWALASALAYGQTDDPDEAMILEVTGVARMSVKPDIGILSLSLQELAPEMATAMSGLAGGAEDYRRALAGLDFPEDEIKTVDFSVGRHTVYRDDERRDSGYVARQSLRVEFAYTPERLATVLRGLAEREVDAEFSFRFRLAEDTKARVQEAIVREAVADAKRKAAYLAEAAGVRLVRLDRINYSGWTGGRPGMEQVTREREYVAAAAIRNDLGIDNTRDFNFTPDDLLFEDAIDIRYVVE